MVFLEVLLALAIERLWGAVTVWRRFNWFMRFAAWSSQRIGHIRAASAGSVPMATVMTEAADEISKNDSARSRAGVLLAILPPVLGVGLIHYLLGESLLILVIFFDVVVLVYCLGPKDLDTQARAFIHACTHADQAMAQRHMADLTDADASPEPRMPAPQMMQSVIEAILIQANERWFAIIFWFFVLGPMGAVLYRLSSVLKYNATAWGLDNFAAAAQHLYAILGWLPARLTAFSYAVTGSFVDAVDGWNQGVYDQIMNRSSGNAGVVVTSGLGALRMHDIVQGTGKQPMGVLHVKSTLALVWRAVVFCLVMLLIINLTSWLIWF